MRLLWDPTVRSGSSGGGLPNLSCGTSDTCGLLVLPRGNVPMACKSSCASGRDLRCVFFVAGSRDPAVGVGQIHMLTSSVIARLVVYEANTDGAVIRMVEEIEKSKTCWIKQQNPQDRDNKTLANANCKTQNNCFSNSGCRSLSSKSLLKRSCSRIDTRNDFKIMLREHCEHLCHP